MDAEPSHGVDKIDEQHKVLFERINDLIEACNQGKGKETVAELITFLKRLCSLPLPGRAADHAELQVSTVHGAQAP